MMKEILSKVVLLALPLVLTAALVAASLTVAGDGVPFVSGEPDVPAASEPESPRDYQPVTEDHPVSVDGGEPYERAEYDYEPILDDEPVNPAGDGME